MASVARGFGIAVEVAAFETWDHAARQLDLITCADAWHWIDPDLGAPKAARVLRPGTLAVFRNFSVMDEPFIDAFDAVYRGLALEVTQVWRPIPSKTDRAGMDSAQRPPLRRYPTRSPRSREGLTGGNAR